MDRCMVICSLTIKVFVYRVSQVQGVVKRDG